MSNIDPDRSRRGLSGFLKSKNKGEYKMGKRKNKKKDLSFRSFLKKCDLKDSKFKKKKDHGE